MTWLLVVAGGMVGASLRYLTDRAIQVRHDTVFPWGTLAVNVVGCLALGVLTGAALQDVAPQSLQLLIGTGLCGALTTYSTFSYETLRLVETRSSMLAALNVAAGIVGGLGAALLGVVVATAIWS